MCCEVEGQTRGVEKGALKKDETGSIRELAKSRRQLTRLSTADRKWAAVHVISEHQRDGGDEDDNDE